MAVISAITTPTGEAQVAVVSDRLCIAGASCAIRELDIYGGQM